MDLHINLVGRNGLADCNTVGVAYGRLMGEGFLVTRIGAGTYVCAAPECTSPRCWLTGSSYRLPTYWNEPTVREW